MKESAISLPNQKNYEYSLGLAYEIACEKLAQIDIDRQCRNSGATCRFTASGQVVTLPYLNRSCQVILPDIKVSLLNSDEDIPLREKLLILHYLIHARGTPLSHKTISFKELPDIKNYFRTFSQRVLQPIATYFGKEPLKLLDAASHFGGKKADYGDMAVTIPAFERAQVTFVLWRGDEEFPPEASAVFDSTISDYLPAEDIIVLSEILAWKLVKLLKTGGTSIGGN